MRHREGTRRLVPTARLAAQCVLMLVASSHGTILGYSAQAVGATVSGKVKNQEGSALHGAKITLTNEETSSSQSTNTSEDGQYIFGTVEAGTYTVSAESRGFGAATRHHVAVSTEHPVAVEFKLAPSQTAGVGNNHDAHDAAALATNAAYYDETQLKPSAVNGSVDPGGYSSAGQGQKSAQLLHGVATMKKDAAVSGGSASTPTEALDAKALAAIEAQLKKVVAETPQQFEANHSLGEFYLHFQALQKGIPYLEKAQRIDPSHYDNGYDLALAYLETSNLAQARVQLHQMIARQDSAELHDLLGEVEEDAGQSIIAANEYERAAHMDPSAGNIFDWGSELLLHLTYDPAIEVFTSGVQRYPSSPMLQIGLGVALYSRGRYDEAIKTLCIASDLSPSDPRPYLFLGRMYNVSAVSADEVTKRLQRFMKIQPQNALAHFYYGMSVWKGQRSQNAEVNLQQIESLLKAAITLDPKFPDAHLQLGNLYADQRKYPEAITEFREAIKLQPDLLDAHYRLAQAYSRTGEQALARLEFELHDRFHKQQLAETERQRAEIKQFVYSMKDNPKP